MKDDVTIFISGDFAPRYRINEIIDRKYYASLFGDILPVMKNSDFRITNLESPLVDNPSPITKTGPNLISPTKSIEALKFAGFDMVTLANNHTMDQGVEGLKSTIMVLNDHDIKMIGAGMSLKDARKPSFVNLQGNRIAFVNFCENEWSTTCDDRPGCNPLDEISLFYQIKNVRNDADFVVVIAHGGHEMYELPSPRMKKLYRWFIDLGADAVIGHHTHCYCGRETYRDKPIVYSLGNFVFDHPKWKSGPWTKGCACLLSLTKKRIGIEMIPFHQCDDRVGIHLFNEKGLAEFNIMDEEKQKIICNDKRLNEEFAMYVQRVGKGVVDLFEPSINKYYQSALAKGFVPHFVTKSHLRQFLNRIRCEAHRDVLLESLKNESI